MCLNMKSAEREKMCINCEGRIPFDAEICPYCASDQAKGRMNNSFQAPLFQSQSLEESLTSLYKPPYQGKRPQFAKALNVPEEEVQDPEPISTYSDTPIYKEVTEKFSMDPLIGATVESEEEERPKSSLWPCLLLTAGVNFFILGLMQALFSKKGVFRLEWDANYWFFYCLLAAPLLFFGFKKLKEFD